MKIRILIVLFIVQCAGLYALDPVPFADVDKHALAAPSTSTQTTEALAAYLAQGLSSEVDKARAAYRWITDSISYDVASFFSGKYTSQDAGAVLAARRSVCAGYAALFADIGARMGLSVEVVRGYAKGYGYSPGALFTQTNHDWNAVRVNGEWRLVDCTWGAGHVNESRRFVKEFTDFFFLTPPEKFVLNHLPADPQWQLLREPWSMDDYTQAVYIYPSGQYLGVSPRSHPKAVFTSAERADVFFDAPPDVVAISSVDGVDNCTLTQVVPGGLEVLCAFPTAGNHRLEVFAKKRSEPGSYSLALEYTVNAQNGVGADGLFPGTYSNFATRGVVLISPLGERLKAGATVDFSVVIPEAEQVAVISGGKWTYMKKDDTQWTAAVVAAPGWVQVCARFPGGSSFEGVLSYQAK